MAGAAVRSSAVPGSLLRSWSGSQLAVGFMLGTVLAYSLIPLLIAQLSVVSAPFLFGGFWRLGVALGAFVFLFVWFRPLLFSGLVWRAAVGLAGSWTLLLAVVDGFDYALFVWALNYVDLSVAELLLGVWPMGFTLVTFVLFRRRGLGYRSGLAPALPCFLASFLGVALLLAAQTGGLVWAGRGWLPAMAGIGLGLGAAALTALGAVLFLWGALLAGRIPVGAWQGRPVSQVVLFGSALGFGLTGLVAAFINLGIGYGLGRSLAWPDWGWAVLGGFGLHAVGSLCLRQANLLSDHPGVNVLAYGNAPVALVWLALFVGVFVERVDYLVLGALLIVASNVLVNLREPRLLPWRGLGLGLLLLGAAVYLLVASPGPGSPLGLKQW